MCSLWKKEKEKKWFGNLQGNFHSSDLQLQGKLDFQLNRLNYEKLIALARYRLEKPGTNLKKTILIKM